MEFLFLGNLGSTEVIVILLIVLLLFGGKKIPELMRGIGSGIREFNSAKNNISNEIREGMRDADRKNLDSENK
ncbi:MAG: twin-arginine translocase TatA/TatE family subunit [Saprospiraceae bacterium]|nr:twin-arginine translocase TatA/TatE family subunit [Saprospiraceae bacterium]MBK8450484.1 twin-arginine translocase TatA/TatE family subunit [Saprospiraceae bacterium]MBK8485431.1 twin-arginine translocase TatA/TatE family subunit [Saprospiraceae bacterium]MBK9222659.1 twin-arginine translocase TatA/TatE family subunit [Saprospiraceae bacterium]MBK9720296.1 twin-arginine translocase TatA/TatE family subunit [Saprospiraceae bacterium]